MNRICQSNNRKTKNGVTLIELIIAMAMMTIIGVATIGLASSIIKYYKAVNDNATAKNIAMMNIDYIRNELQDAKEIEIFSTSKLSTTTIEADNISAILSSDGNSQLMRYEVTQGASGHVLAPATAAVGIVTGEDGKTEVWKTSVLFVKPQADDLPVVSVLVDVFKNNTQINQWSTTIYLPNVEINTTGHVVFPAGETEGTHMFYIKGLIN